MIKLIIAQLFTQFILLFVIFAHNHQVEGIPSLDETSQEPINVITNNEALIDCKVNNIGNYTVLWRFINPSTGLSNGEILTVGKVKVTSDPRFTVLHHSDKNLWILRISSTYQSDSGIYVCEVNTVPKIRISRIVNVKNKETFSKQLKDVDHNYTDCCINENVPQDCFAFCHFKTLVTYRQPPAVVSTCIKHLPSITKCLADGRDHLPCCKKQNVPLPCQPVCSGNFTLTTVTEHFTCLNYAAPVLACIAQGVKTLPSRPEEIIVEPASKTELYVQWRMDEKSPKIDGYYINVTQLHSFDEIGATAALEMNTTEANEPTEKPSLFGLEMSYKVNSNQTEYNITGLKQYTMYEIKVIAFNTFGTSLPSDAIRALTLESDEHLINSNETDRLGPKLPDIKKCCQDGGVTLGRCVDILCDPSRADEATITDMMLCAPWSNVTFKCMATGVDHTECCEQRGVSKICLPFCKGNVNRIDFRHFTCLDHMSTYTSCIMDHYGVLPSAPVDFKVVNVHHTWAILKWKKPKVLSDTVTMYHVLWREKNADGAAYSLITASQSPFLLDDLTADKRYEVFAVAVNKYGVSQGSSRILFSTPPHFNVNYDYETEITEGTSAKPKGYNESVCCKSANMRSTCHPLCSYSVKVADIIQLGPQCVDTLPTLIRCGAGGRNHVPCCRRRAVKNRCLNLCAGLIDSSPFAVATQCVEDLGKIIQCMEEGSGIIPGMPIDFHATLVTKNSVHLSWKPAVEDDDDAAGKATIYQVRYDKSYVNSPLHPLEHGKSQNATTTSAVITGLEPESLYSFYVVAANAYGISLPSLVLLLNTTASDDKKILVHANIGPPHEIEVLRQNVDSITFKWLPPLFIPPDSTVSYIVHYKAVNGTEADIMPSVTDKWISVETVYNTMIITNLTYNTEYAIAIQSKTDKNVTSTLSEMVLVWTDPPIPASVNLPVIIPAGPVAEGNNITVMCIGMGIPIPTLSLYINGYLMKREEKRHIAVAVQNVQRNLTSVTCYAVNGFGKDSRSAQSTMEVRVHYKPTVTPYTPATTMAYIDGPARLQCLVSGNPQPQVLWYKDLNNRAQIVEGPNTDFIVVPHTEDQMTWIYTLLLRKTSTKDFGVYTCSGHNQYGESQTEITLKQDHTKTPNIRNSTECCIAQGVAPQCIDTCKFDVDIEKALSIPACYADLDKLMFCAADGSDHRQCCRKKLVPIGCLRWCAGLKVTPTLCSLSSAKEIVSCFEEGRVLLPGPPKDIRVRDSTNDNLVIIEWSPPVKNPDLVEFYRVFWRPVGSRDLLRNQTDNLYFEIRDLEPDKMYEFVVKSGNHFGLSTFTDPLVVPSHSWVSASASFGNRLLKVFFGLSIAIVLIIFGSGAVIYGYKYYYLPRRTQSNGISFENPSYLKDGTVQIYDSPRREQIMETSENGPAKIQTELIT